MPIKKAPRFEFDWIMIMEGNIELVGTHRTGAVGQEGRVAG